jgi:hypothetical protein
MYDLTLTLIRKKYSPFAKFIMFPHVSKLMQYANI